MTYGAPRYSMSLSHGESNIISIGPEALLWLGDFLSERSSTAGSRGKDVTICTSLFQYQQMCSPYRLNQTLVTLLLC